MVLVNQHYHRRLWDIHHEVTQGEVLLDGVNILELEVDERAKVGLFLAMQYPSEITGVTNATSCVQLLTRNVKKDKKST